MSAARRDSCWRITPELGLFNETADSDVESSRSFTSRLKKPATSNNRYNHSLDVEADAIAIAKDLQIPKRRRQFISAIILPHDLGHPPFGHEGEDALKDCLIRLKEAGVDVSPEMADHNRNGLRKAVEIGIPLGVFMGLLYHDGLPLSDEKVAKKFSVKTLRQKYRGVKPDGEKWPPLEFQIAAIADDIANTARDVLAIIKDHNQKGPGITFAQLCFASSIFRDATLERIIVMSGSETSKAAECFRAHFTGQTDAPTREELDAVDATMKCFMSEQKKADNTQEAVTTEREFLRAVTDEIRIAFRRDVVQQVLERAGNANEHNRDAVQPIVGLSKDMKAQMELLKSFAKETREQMSERKTLNIFMKTIFECGMEGKTRGFPHQITQALSECTSKKARAETLIPYLFELEDRDAYKLYKGICKAEGIAEVKTPSHISTLVDNQRQRNGYH